MVCRERTQFVCLHMCVCVCVCVYVFSFVFVWKCVVQNMHICGMDMYMCL